LGIRVLSRVRVGVETADRRGSAGHARSHRQRESRSCRIDAGCQGRYDEPRRIADIGTS